jgi:dipeptide/tripeptide permease
MTTQSLPAARSGFPTTFWVANVMELFERAAYYGMNSVLAVYLTRTAAEGGLGFTEDSVGFLQSIVYAATYVIPILGGALADRYGYRRMLMVAFSLMACGYFAAGYMSSYAAVFLALLVMATGSGLFKPIISGTIARTTDESNSAFGFGIYYWMINLGAFLAPLVVSVLKGFSWQYVFAASAAYTGLMLLPTLAIFRDPPRPESTKTLSQVMVGAAEVLADSRFMLMIVVYSGFWILYFQNFGSVLWYLRDFIDKAPVSQAVTSWFAALGLGWTFTFDAEHVTVINAGTIILLQVVVSRIVKKWPPLPTMVTGMAFGAVGFALLAASRNPWVFILGIAIFSIGEMTAHPKYYSFVGLVAPADRKAVYMGYAFLYGVVGSLLGSSLGAFLYSRMLKPYAGTLEADAQVRLFWGLFAVLDVIAAAGLVLFSRMFGPDTPETRSRARVVMRGVYALILCVGAAFLYAAFAADHVQPRIAVQSLIFVTLGVFGLVMSRKQD